MVEKIKRMENTTNKLASMVDTLRLNTKRAPFKRLDGRNVQQFPTLSIEQLKEIAVGTYQVEKGASYYAEHVDQESRYEILVAQRPGTMDFMVYDINIVDLVLLKPKCNQGTEIRSNTTYTC